MFAPEVVPQAPEDPLFGLMAAYRQDTFDKKVDLGIGAYRDNNAKPWVLPVVKKVSHILQEIPLLLLKASEANYVLDRPTKSFAMTPTLTMNISPLPACQNSLQPLKS